MESTNEVITPGELTRLRVHMSMYRSLLPLLREQFNRNEKLNDLLAEAYSAIDGSFAAKAQQVEDLSGELRATQQKALALVEESEEGKKQVEELQKEVRRLNQELVYVRSLPANKELEELRVRVASHESESLMLQSLFQDAVDVFNNLLLESIDHKPQEESALKLALKLKLELKQLKQKYETCQKMREKFLRGLRLIIEVGDANSRYLASEVLNTL